MPVTRRYIDQDQEECQILLMDSQNTFLVNHSNEWQFLFGPTTSPTPSVLKITIAAQFNTENFNGIKLIAYLFEDQTGSVSALGSLIFSVYKVVSPEWQDQLIGNFSGTELSNSYIYRELSLTDLGGIELSGETTLMVEAAGLRLGQIYRGRIYINHLGVSDSILRLRQNFEYLNILKKDE